MRQPVRPFITAYKYRSSKTRASRAWDVEEPEKVDSKPSPVGFGADQSPRSERGVSYSAAMAAADALFGGAAPDPVAPSTPSSAAPGRILPSLLQAREPSIHETEPARKAPRASVKAKPKKAISPEPQKTKAPATRSKPVVAQRAVEPAPVLTTADIENAAPAPRDRSSIQGRWVRRTDLKPGEKWKRRLCERAR
jgi:hypothetical protein